MNIEWTNSGSHGSLISCLIGVNLKTGDIFPATYPDKGPDIPLRGARLFTGSHCVRKKQLILSIKSLSAVALTGLSS